MRNLFCHQWKAIRVRRWVKEYLPGKFHVTLTANGAAALSLAKHLIYLSQADVPIRARLIYRQAEGLSAGQRLILEREEFEPLRG